MADVDSNGNGDSCDGVDCEIEQPTDDWSQNLNYGEVVVPDPLQAKDYAISVALLALVVGVLLYSYRMKGESRMWARTETLIVMLYGLSCYFVPNAMYQNFTLGRLDNAHAFLIQLIGAVLISLGAVRLCSEGSEDNSVHASLIFSRFLGGAILLMTLLADQASCHFSNDHLLSDQHLVFAVFGCALWVAGNFVMLWQFENRGRLCTHATEVNSRLGAGILIDLISSMSVIFWCYGYPALAYGSVRTTGFKYDGIHVHLLKILAVLLFVNALHGIASLRFFDDDDRQPFLFGQITVYVLLVPLLVGQSNVLDRRAVWFSYTVLFILLLNAANAYFYRGWHYNRRCPTMNKEKQKDS